MSKLLILGAGGHGKVIADCALETGRYSDISFLDDASDKNKVLGFPIIGKIIEAKNFLNEYSEAIVAVGNNLLRVELINMLQEAGFTVPVLIHPSATVSRFSTIGPGTVVLARSVVSPEVKIGNGGIINTAASVDHDCSLGKGVHISPGVRLAGGVFVEDYVWICIGASVSNNVNIYKNSIVAAGAVVIRDIEENVLAAGVPAIVKGRIKDEK